MCYVFLGGSGNSFNPGAPVFQPQSEQGTAPGVAPFPAPPRMRPPQMARGQYPIPPGIHIHTCSY